MTKTENAKRTRRLIRIRRVLHQAESQIWLDAPTYTDMETALNVLNQNLSPKLKTKVFKRNHIELKHSFWVKVTDRNRFVRFVNIKDVMLIFHKIIHYCNYWSAKYGETVTTNRIPSNPLE